MTDEKNTDPRVVRALEQFIAGEGPDVIQSLEPTDGVGEYVITFGSQYKRDPQYGEPHPQDMSANGWFVIEAPDELMARRIALAIFDTKWSMIYTAAEFASDGAETIRRWYPEGELGRYSLRGTNLIGEADAQ